MVIIELDEMDGSVIVRTVLDKEIEVGTREIIYHTTGDEAYENLSLVLDHYGLTLASILMDRILELETHLIVAKRGRSEWRSMAERLQMEKEKRMEQDSNQDAGDNGKLATDYEDDLWKDALEKVKQNATGN